MGDFVEYNTTRSGTGNLVNIDPWQSTGIYTVIAMNETYFTINASIYAPSHHEYLVENWSKEWIFGEGLNESLWESFYNLTKVGREDITTNWGPLCCDHYNSTFYYGQGNVRKFDFWIKDGISVKSVFYNAELLWGSATFTRMLIDTNIPAITNP